MSSTQSVFNACAIWYTCVPMRHLHANAACHSPWGCKRTTLSDTIGATPSRGVTCRRAPILHVTINQSRWSDQQPGALRRHQCRCWCRHLPFQPRSRLAPVSSPINYGELSLTLLLLTITYPPVRPYPVLPTAPFHPPALRPCDARKFPRSAMRALAFSRPEERARRKSCSPRRRPEPHRATGRTPRCCRESESVGG